MDHDQSVEKSKPHIIIGIIEYVPDAVVSRTIIKKTTGNVTATSMAIGEEVGAKTAKEKKAMKALKKLKKNGGEKLIT